ncbi:MAG: hypothetical protein ACOC93_06030 [Planctomycetota bacterium]
MATPLMLQAALSDYFSAWQLIPLVLLIAILVGYKIYRNKQM